VRVSTISVSAFPNDRGEPSRRDQEPLALQPVPLFSDEYADLALTHQDLWLESDRRRSDADTRQTFSLFSRMEAPGLKMWLFLDHRVGAGLEQTPASFLVRKPTR
jgi:hypothetical protein